MSSQDTAYLYNLAWWNAVGFGGYMLAKAIYTRISLRKRADNKREVTKKHVGEVLELLKEFKLSPALEEELPRADVTRIHELLKKGEVTCVDLIKFFTKLSGKRCLELNAIVDFLYDEAIGMAKEKDQQLKALISSGKELPLLFGIPISLKDVLNYKNHDTSMGSAAFTFDPCDEHGLIVLQLLEAGGIPFVKTNCPQLLLINETNNFIWGRAKNPWDLERSTGGSSGGEGAIVATGCSPIGIGSDGGGSVRIPATYCGIFGIRPTARRYTLLGHKPPSSYTPRHIFGCIGPMTKTASDSIRVMEALQNYKILNRFDPLLPTVEWKREVVEEYSQKRLRIGVMRRFDVSSVFIARSWEFSRDSKILWMRRLLHLESRVMKSSTTNSTRNLRRSFYFPS